MTDLIFRAACRAGAALIALLAAATTASAVDSACGPGERAAPIQAGRVALIVTNENYRRDGEAATVLTDLPATKKDGEILCRALERLGFEVTLQRDRNRSQMVDDVLGHGKRMKAAGRGAIGFFYYSGHGAASTEGGQNYLIPVEATITKRRELEFNAILLQTAIKMIAGDGHGLGQANFIVIDACRCVDFPERSGSRGLAPMPLGGGVFVGFSTAPGRVAVDANHYSGALAKALTAPNATAFAAFRSARRDVLRATGGEQFPWHHDGLVNDVVFNRDARAGAPKPEPAFTAPSPAVMAALDGADPKALPLDGCALCPQMIPIEGRDVALARTETTFAEWQDCVSAGHCSGYVPDDEGWGRGDRPVVNVSYQDAESYARWLRETTGRAFRLPTEEEWTAAAPLPAAATGERLCDYANGAQHRLIGGMGCHDGRERGTQKAGTYEPNAAGLYDMAGNVWEWVQGCAGRSEEAGGERCLRALRGGSWESGVQALTPESRRLAPGGYRSGTAGFRVALDTKG